MQLISPSYLFPLCSLPVMLSRITSTDKYYNSDFTHHQAVVHTFQYVYVKEKIEMD